MTFVRSAYGKAEPYLPLLLIFLLVLLGLRYEVRLLALEMRVELLEPLDYQVMVINHNAIGRNKNNVGVMMSRFPVEVREDMLRTIEVTQGEDSANESQVDH